MFVKVVSKDVETGRWYDGIYECSHVLSQTVDEGLRLTLEREGSGSDAITLLVSYGEHDGVVAVYLMNDAGRTIDTLFNKEWHMRATDRPVIAAA